MIKSKPKICKSTGNAKGFQGCGDLSDKRSFGLCPKCKYSWATSTEEGKKWFETQMAYKKKKNEKEEKKKNREEHQKMKIDVMSADKYRSKYVQPLINKIARFIDYGNPCIATGNFEGKMAGGHYTSVGSNRTICLNLHNVFIQSFHSNSWNAGDDKRYREGLKNTFGEDYLNFIESLKRHRPIQLRKPQLIDIKTKAQIIVNSLEKNKTILTSDERIKFRNEVNITLNIYDKEFCEFIN